MSDHEFDNYLALLAKLLRLDSKQREAIAGELRAHLEERLDELLARGIPRQEAVRLALEEFGDAAGLAAQFSSLSRNRRRRWLMRVTTFSAAAMVLVATGLAIFWPGRNAGPGVAEVVAQVPDEKEPVKDGADDRTPKREAKTLSEKLNQRMDFLFTETPLKDVAVLLEEQTGVQFVLNVQKLEEAGVNSDTLVTRPLKQVRLSTYLDLMLDELELVYVERDDDLIIITTPEDAESTLEVRVYDCRDLLELTGAQPTSVKARRAVPMGPGGVQGGGDLLGGAPVGSTPAPGGLGLPPPTVIAPGGVPGLPLAVPPDDSIVSPPGGGPMPMAGAGGVPPSEAGNEVPAGQAAGEQNALIQVLVTNVDPQSWDKVGGPGQISEFHGLIVVTQTAQTHKKIERVLDMLREAAGLEVPKSGKVVR